MLVNDIDPFVRFCDVIPAPAVPDQDVMAYDCRLFYIVSGTGRLYVAGNAYELQPGAVLLLPAGTPYRFAFGSSPSHRLIPVNFDYDRRQTALEISLRPVPAPDFAPEALIAAPDAPLFRQVHYVACLPSAYQALTEIAAELRERKPYYQEKASVLLKNILIDIFRFDGEEAHFVPPYIRELRDYINDHYAEKLTRGSLGRRFGYHAVHLNRMFKTCFGTTLHQYIILCRLDAATRLLSGSVMSIEAVAAAVGFADQAYFTQVFKAHTGMTPSSYRSARQHEL